MADALRRIARHGDDWLRRYGSKAWSGDDWLGGKPGAAGPGGLKARLAEAREVLRKVRETATELEGKLKKFEAELGEGRTAGPAKPRPSRGGAKSGRRAGSHRD